MFIHTLLYEYIDACMKLSKHRDNNLKEMNRNICTYFLYYNHIFYLKQINKQNKYFLVITNKNTMLTSID